MRSFSLASEPCLTAEWDEVLKAALAESVRLEYQESLRQSEPMADPEFSLRFRQRMEKIFPMAEHRYTSFGRRSVRRAALIAAILTLILAASGAVVAVTVPQIHYLIFKNNISWNLFFEQEDPAGTSEKEFRAIKPNFPEGFTVTEEFLDTGWGFYSLNAEDPDGNRIIYDQNFAIGTGVTLNSEVKSIREETIDGHRFVISEDDPTSVILFDNGSYIFTITGDCDVEILIDMGKEVLKQP